MRNICSGVSTLLMLLLSSAAASDSSSNSISHHHHHHHHTSSSSPTITTIRSPISDNSKTSREYSRSKRRISTKAIVSELQGRNDQDKEEPVHRAISSPTLLEKDGVDFDRRQERKIVPLLTEILRGGGGDDTGGNALVADLLHRLKIGSYFAAWYFLNIMYNIVNKKVLNVLPAPLTVGSIQFGVGALYSTLVWSLGLREKPSQAIISKEQDLKVKTKTFSSSFQSDVRIIGLFHGVGQLFSMVSLGAGTVSFTHIVKALEPFFSALVSALVFGKWMAAPVYATLLPVVGGVGYACLKDRAFSWLAFGTAMGSNVAFAFRAVQSKRAMKEWSAFLSSANLFGLVTWVAFLWSIPVAMIGEGSTFLTLWRTVTTTSMDGQTGAKMPQLELIQKIIVSGLFHYLNNEVMYLALSNVHPVTLAVGNTMKRVFIVVASVLVFRTPISMQVAIGSTIGITGVLLYSLTKQYYEKLEAISGGGGNKKKKAIRKR